MPAEESADRSGERDRVSARDGDSSATRPAPAEEAGGTVVHTSLELHTSGDRYEVLEELGRGGMGEVHLCFDRRIGRQIARKRRTKGASELKRFLREISVQGQLEHPTIVPLHDLSFGDDGEIYFTMKAIRGRTLKSILAARADGDPAMLAQYPVRKLLHAFSNVCLGVAFAHSRGVVHRDLKPNNLMLGEFGEVYILDWGVAKLMAAHDPDEDGVRVLSRGSATKVGSMIGTAGYMSPEQASAEDGVDERADVYALGAILFEILAGEPLHAGSPLEKIDSTLGGGDVRERVTRGERKVDPDLLEACVRATAVQRDERLPSARDLNAAIERTLSHDPEVDGAVAVAVRAPEPATDVAAPVATGAIEPAHLDAMRSGARLSRYAGVVLLVVVSLLAIPAVGAGAWAWACVASVAALCASAFAFSLFLGDSVDAASRAGAEPDREP